MPDPRAVGVISWHVHCEQHIGRLRRAAADGRNSAKLGGAGGGRGVISMKCGDPMCVNVNHINFCALDTNWNGDLRCSPIDMDCKQSACKALKAQVDER